MLAPHAVDIAVTISSLIATLCFTFAEPFDDIFLFVKSSCALVSGNTWVEFVVDSRPCSEGFSTGSPVFLPPQKSTFLNSNSIGNSRAILQTTGLPVNYVTLVK